MLTYKQGKISSCLSDISLPNCYFVSIFFLAMDLRLYETEDMRLKHLTEIVFIYVMVV